MNKKECKQKTLKHINYVRLYLLQCIQGLADRANIHDSSKLESPELEIFMEYTSKLAESTYGSKEYKQFLKEMQPALNHHYHINRHHPEHFRKGIVEMNLLDLIEMLCDWKAATKRHNNGNVFKSIELNQKRFNYSDELKQILLNTIGIFTNDD